MKQQERQPYSDTIWDEAETWSRDRIEQFQLDALRRQLQRVARTSNHYRQVFAAAGFEPGDLKSLDDLRRLPFTHKRDYLAGLQAEPPFGSLAAVAPGEAVRVHFSSGTTARPAPVLWTQADIERWADLYARYLYGQGLRRGDVFQCMFNYAWFVGGLGATLAAQHVGALVIPASSGDTQRQIETIYQYGTQCVIGTPSFMAHMAEAAQAMGRDLATSPVRMVCVVGEPGASIPGTRERIERQWGARMYDCYGALECQPIGWDTAAQLEPTLAEDFIYVEILHLEPHEPVADGERGVLVLTHLDKQACPLVRWWTGDIVVRDSRPAPDGRTHARLTGGVLGRSDDMLIVRGVNLFPSAIEDVVRAFPGLTNEYVIVLDDSLKDPNTGFLTGVKLRVERESGAAADVGERLSQRLREKLQVRFQVEVVESGTLPRTVHKAKRVIHA
ncbi:phenylacetate--CoA ligase family protein [Bordetella pertussis]|uniref:phenylacetate--CoA ligase family protein n=1 Tax=Bordetella pertussis TaxID=520 RepID=UPI0005DD3AC0|nr:AMP-binding protein [Bordetella pertussis]CFU30189.1 coenzyme A ligase [Bordetella pertussis]